MRNNSHTCEINGVNYYDSIDWKPKHWSRFKMVHVEFYKEKIALLLTDVFNISAYFVLILVYFPFEFNCLFSCFHQIIIIPTWIAFSSCQMRIVQRIFHFYSSCLCEFMCENHSNCAARGWLQKKNCLTFDTSKWSLL